MTNKIRFIQYALFLLTLISATTVFADVKIKTRNSAGGQTSESTTYIKGNRQRSEMGAESAMISIMQCDLRRTVQLSPAAKTYMVSLFDQPSAAQTAVTKTDGRIETTVVRGGTVTTIITIKDTGERKQLFGYTARRVITTMETQPSPDACSKDKTKMEMDDWVIDAEFALVCNELTQNGYVAAQGGGGCQDKQIIKNVGSAKSGYPIRSKMTFFDDNGNPSVSTTSEVLELSKATLPVTLFDVPADYREVKDSSELYALSDSTSSRKNVVAQMPQLPGANIPSDSNSSASVKNISNNSGNTSTEIGAKKAGVIRLGLAGVKTGSVGEGVNAQELSAAVQNTLPEYLKMPNVEVVRLEAKLPSAIDAEAKEKECDYVIYAQVSHKKGGGGMFGKALGKLSETVSRRAYGSSDTVGKVSQITIMTAAAASGDVKAKDQITLEIKLVAPASASPVAAKQFQAKAKADGENIITTLIEQAAQTILDQTAKK